MDSDSVISIEKEAECNDFVINIPDLPPVEWPECCIYRVPKLLRKVKEEAYTPKLVSIGPFHHGREELRDMEMHKMRYFKDFFELRKPKKSQKDLASIIAAKEEDIRHCYSETFELISCKDFVRMILLDSIFIIEFFLKLVSTEGAEEKDYIQSKMWLRNGIFDDLIVLENQLPFFVLDGLYMSAFSDSSSLSHDQEGEQSKEHKGDSNKKDTPFLDLSRRCFSSYDIDNNDKKRESNIDGKHFTDLVRNFFCTPNLKCTEDKRESKIDGKVPKHFTDLVRYFFCPPNLDCTEDMHHIAYTATELDEGGIKFKPVEDRRLLDITFPLNKCLKYCPCFNLSWLLACLPCLKCFPCLESIESVLKVPKFNVEDSTECLLRNLMALEQCHYQSEAFICNYVLLLDHLIDSEKDVELLVNKEIIINMLGSNAAVADLINKLCLEIVEDGSCYSVLSKEINVYRANQWNRLMATMKNVYFRDFWRGTATVVGLIVLGFTFWSFLRPYVT